MRADGQQIKIFTYYDIKSFDLTKFHAYVLDNCITTFRVIKSLGYKTVQCGVISEHERKMKFRRRHYIRFMI